MNFSPGLLPNKITNAQIKNKKMNRELSAGTTDEQSTKDDNQHVSPACIKPNVACCPVRVQRKRVKGWRMPENTVSVTRPGRWGNPFKIGDYVRVGMGNGLSTWQYIKACSAKYADESYTHIETIEQCIELYRKYITNYPPKDLHELEGKNLACFCPLDKPCHADVLLECANR